MASRSGSEEKKPRRQQQTYESEGEESEEYQPQPRQRRRNQVQQRRGGQGPLDNLALDNVQNTAGGLVNSATGVLGGVAGNAVQDQKGGGKSDTLRLRLDLNLDVEITLKAKIHGDLELALLYVALFSYLAPPPRPSPPLFLFSSVWSAKERTSLSKCRRGSSVSRTSVSQFSPLTTTTTTTPPFLCFPSPFLHEAKGRCRET
jgi:hypothetical protein